MNQLLQVGLVQLYEVKVDRVATLIYFTDQQRVHEWCINEMCRIIVNLHLRLAKVQK